MLDWLALELLSVVSVLLLCEQQLQLPWVLDWLALELLSVPSVLLCEQQPQLPLVLDWLAFELLSVPSVQLPVQQLQLPRVLDWLALELLSVPSVLLCEQQQQRRMSVTAVRSAEGELRYRHSSAPGSCSCCTHSNRSGPHRAPPPPVAALELLSLLPVLLCVQQPQLPLGAQLACTRKHTELLWRCCVCSSRSCRGCSIGRHSSCCCCCRCCCA